MTGESSARDLAINVLRACAEVRVLDPGPPECIVCSRFKGARHRDDCALAQALAALETAPTEEAIRADERSRVESGICGLLRQRATVLASASEEDMACEAMRRAALIVVELIKQGAYTAFEPSDRHANHSEIPNGSNTPEMPGGSQ